jgi:hypothetical protein
MLSTKHSKASFLHRHTLYGLHAAIHIFITCHRRRTVCDSGSPSSSSVEPRESWSCHAHPSGKNTSCTVHITLVQPKIACQCQCCSVVLTRNHLFWVAKMEADPNLSRELQGRKEAKEHFCGALPVPKPTRSTKEIVHLDRLSAATIGIERFPQERRIGQECPSGIRKN